MIEQFKTVVIAAGAEAKCIERRPGGAERLVINTFGGLVAKEIPLKGELDKDIENVTLAARQIVATAKSLTAEPATKLSRTAVTKPTLATMRVRAY
ncbi:MAG: hypothetical protein ABSC06_33850 [Rhodopila sp.]